MADLLALIVLMAFPAIVVSISPTWIMRGVFAFITFFIGLLVQIEGIVYNSVTIIAANSQMSFVLMLFLTLGSVVTAYSTAIKKDIEVT